MKKSKAKALPPIYVVVGAKDGLLANSASETRRGCYEDHGLPRYRSDRIIKYVPAPARRRKGGKRRGG